MDVINKILEFLDIGTLIHSASAADYIITGIMLLLFITTLLLCVLRRDKKPVPTMEYYPPEGINPAEAAYIINGELDTHDVFSLIYHWAAHGHITIEDHTEDRTSEDQPSLILYKKSKLDSAHKNYEHALFDALWEKGSNGHKATDKDLDECIAKNIGAAVEALPYIYNYSTALVDKSSHILPKLARTVPTAALCLFLLILNFSCIHSPLLLIGTVFICFTTLCLTALQRGREHSTYGILPVKNSIALCIVVAIVALLEIFLFCRFPVHISRGLIILTASIAMACSWIFVGFLIFNDLIGSANILFYTLADKNKCKVLSTVSAIIATAAAVVVAYSFGGDAIHSLPLAISALFMCLTIMLSGKLYRRTDYCVALSGRCIGLRETLKTARKDEVEMLCRENPEYYYDILPYLQVFGITQIWKDRFQYLINGKLDA